MITRPLDLASRLRPEPRSFDWLFYVNAVVLVLFFVIFGSRFVLAPGLNIELQKRQGPAAEFSLPVAPGANANAKPTTHFISVLASGQIYTPHGTLKTDQLETWLAAQAKTTKSPVLLVRGDNDVPVSVMTLISGTAEKVGFAVIWAAVDSTDSARTEGR